MIGTEVSINWEICKLEKTSNKNDFDCGTESLNEFLHKFAWQNQKREMSTTYIMKNIKDESILGYYTLSMKTFKKAQLPIENQKGLSENYDIFLILLARLAISKAEQGKGFGQKLILDSMLKVFEISEKIGILGFTVDAIDEKAKKFYKKFDFTELPENEMKLMIPKNKLIEQLTKHNILIKE